MPPRAELIRWCSQYPPHLTSGDLQYFFEELIQGDSDIFEYQQNGQRSAVFVFLSKVKNRHCKVPLDLIAHVPYTDLEAPLFDALARAQMRLPAGTSGIVVNLPARAGHLGAKLVAQGCRFLHECFHMVAPTIKDQKPTEGIREIPAEDYRTLYDLTITAFGESPDIVIPEFDLWVKRRDHHATRSFGVYGGADGKTLIAFCNLILNDQFVDIRTLGVAPEARRQGWGERLLRHALHFTHEQGKPNCELTVSVNNRNALQLYERIGFKAFSSTLSWTWDVV